MAPPDFPDSRTTRKRNVFSDAGSDDPEQRRRFSKRQALDLDSLTPASESASPKSLPRLSTSAKRSSIRLKLHSSLDHAMESKLAAQLSRRKMNHLSEKKGRKRRR